MDAQSWNDDFDRDGILNIEEFLRGTHPAEMGPDADGDGVEDDWEKIFFTTVDVTNGRVDTDGDGVIDFFEYLHGSNPREPSDAGFYLRVNPGDESDPPTFVWKMREQFKIGTHYDVYISTDLVHWTLLPDQHFTLNEVTADGMMLSQLEVEHDYGATAYIRLQKPIQL